MAAQVDGVFVADGVEPAMRRGLPKGGAVACGDAAFIRLCRTFVCVFSKATAPWFLLMNGIVRETSRGERKTLER